MANGDWQIVDEQPVVDESTSPGARLREARERAGWTRESFAAELKLPPTRLARLEADDFAAFGPPVFVRGYLRRCAILLRLPPEEILALYEAAAGPEAPPVEIGLPPGRPPRADRSGWIGPAVAVVLIAAVLAGGWWFFGPSGEESVPVARRPAPEKLAPLTIEPPEAESPRSEPEVHLAEARPAEAPTDAGTGTPADEAPVPVAQDVFAEAAATVEDALAAAAPGSPPVVPSETTIPAGQADIRIRLLEDCWLEIIDAEGRRLAYRLGRAGEVTRVRGTAPVSVFLGNAEGVELTVDGETVAVRPAARRDGTARLTVGGGAG